MLHAIPRHIEACIRTGVEKRISDNCFPLRCVQNEDHLLMCTLDQTKWKVICDDQ